MSIRDSIILNEPTVGIIIPPPEIKRVIDNAAELIAKYGSNIVSMMEKEVQNNPKFSFLKEGDPFRSYYIHKVDELAKDSKNKQVNSNDNINTDNIINGEQNLFLGRKTQAVNNIKSDIISDKRKKQQEELRKLIEPKKLDSHIEVKAPSLDQFSIHHPNISPLDM